MVVVFTFVPIISSVSILSYQSFLAKELVKQDGNPQEQLTKADLEQILEKYQDSQVEEILLLKIEINELKQAINLANGNLDFESDDVLGVQDTANSIENLKKRLTKTSISPEDLELKSVYIKTEEPGITMHVSPSITSKEIKDFKIGMLYPALKQQDNWQEIDFGNGQSAWIDKKYIINFPIDENN